MTDIEVASCSSIPYNNNKNDRFKNKAATQALDTEDYPTTKKVSRQHSNELIKSLNFSRKINSSFRSEQSGEDVERGLSSSFDGEIQGGLKSQQCENLSDKTKHFIRNNWAKILTVTLLFVGQLAVKFGGMIQDKVVDKPEDKLQDATEPINQFLLNMIITFIFCNKIVIKKFYLCAFLMNKNLLKNKIFLNCKI